MAIDWVGARIQERSTGQSGRYWLPPLLGAAIYPELIDLFSRTVDVYLSSGRLQYAAAATVLMLMAGSITPWQPGR